MNVRSGLRYLREVRHFFLQIILGCFITVAGAAGGMYGIIQNSKSKPSLNGLVNVMPKTAPPIPHLYLH